MHQSIIDAHIHLDLYEGNERQQILHDLEKGGITSLISVSNHLQSAKNTLDLTMKNTKIKPAFGYHPEQELPDDCEVEELLRFIQENNEKMVAIGEVGLPYYLRKKNSSLSLNPYIELLEIFIRQAVHYNVPIVLHAVYDDAPIVCDLLERYSIEKAHFHWFKGDAQTIKRMIANQYFISVTPDVFYEKEIQELVKQYPLSLMMVETDGPWPFKGPFSGMMTHPNMIQESIKKIASIKRLDLPFVYQTLYKNTKTFYNI